VLREGAAFAPPYGLSVLRLLDPYALLICGIGVAVGYSALAIVELTRAAFLFGTIAASASGGVLFALRWTLCRRFVRMFDEGVSSGRRLMMSAAVVKALQVLTWASLVAAFGCLLCWLTLWTLGVRPLGIALVMVLGGTLGLWAAAIRLGRWSDLALAALAQGDELNAPFLHPCKQIFWPPARWRRLRSIDAFKIRRPGDVSALSVVGANMVMDERRGPVPRSAGAFLPSDLFELRLILRGLRTYFQYAASIALIFYILGFPGARFLEQTLAPWSPQTTANASGQSGADERSSLQSPETAADETAATEESEERDGDAGNGGAGGGATDGDGSDGDVSGGGAAGSDSGSDVGSGGASGADGSPLPGSEEVASSDRRSEEGGEGREAESSNPQNGGSSQADGSNSGADPGAGDSRSAEGSDEPPTDQSAQDGGAGGGSGADGDASGPGREGDGSNAWSGSEGGLADGGSKRGGDGTEPSDQEAGTGPGRTEAPDAQGGRDVSGGHGDGAGGDRGESGQGGASGPER